MSLSSLSVRRRITFVMLFTAVLGIGLYGLSQLGVDLYPDMEFPMIMVVSTLSGAGPEEMENLVTEPLEQAMARVSKVKKITSTSTAGLSWVMAEFEWGIDLEQAETDVRRMIDQYQAMLPEDATDPFILALDPSMQPVMYIGFTSELLDDYEVRRLIEEQIEPLLNRLDGVGSVTTMGGLTREIQVVVDPARLQTAGLTLSQIVGSLASVRNNLPAGTVDAGGMRINLRIESAFHGVEEVEQLVVGMNQGRTVQLRDVAEVIDGRSEVLSHVRFDGEPAVATFVNRRSDANTVNVCREIKEQLDRIERDYAGQIKPYILWDQSEFIEGSIGNLSSTAVQAAFFAILVLLFFLRSWRGSAIIGLAIPMSITATFAVMHFTHVDLNMISLAGLALAIGLLVDNAIVVLENIYRHRQLGDSIWNSAVKGASEVSMAITASTLTTLAVFLPILFVPGLAGQIFREMVLTISFSLAVSLFVALSLVPLLSSWARKLVPKHRPKSIPDRIDRGFRRVESGYTSVVSWAVGNRRKVIIGAIALFVVSLLLLGQVPTDFFPQNDNGFLQVMVDLPEGTTLATTDSVIRLLEDTLRTIVAPEDMIALYSSSGEAEGAMAIFGQSGTNSGEVMVRMTSVERRSTSSFEYQDRVRAVLDNMPGIDYSMEESHSFMTGDPIEIRIYGDNLDSLYYYAEYVKSEMEKIEGATEVVSSMQEQQPELTFVPDPAVLALYGFNSTMVANELSYGVMGTNATIFRDGGEEYQVFVRYPESCRDSRADIEYAPVNGVPLAALGVLRERLTSTGIERINQTRVATVSCKVSGRSLGQVAADVGRMLGEIDHRGFRIEIGGQMKDQAETFMYLGIAILVAALLVYMVMASQFESLLEPFIIIFTVPMAFIGVVWILFLTGTTLSVVSLIGMLMLAGIVVNNGIVMIDYANQLRRRGTELMAAIVQAATTRMRPIMMTASTTILALMPLAVGVGEGSETWAPMALTVIGGLLAATILTLVVEPCIYVVFGKRKKFRTAEETGPAAGETSG
jgi:HAE1 family hydrophobic/amphiphilic exporter-1